MSEIDYYELVPYMVTQQRVDDINHLLPQLSSSAEPVTHGWLVRIMGKGTRVFVATDNTRIISVVLLVRTHLLVGYKDWIEDVVTDEAYRRQGISSKLMDMAEAVSREKAKAVNLTSNPDRGGARKMYGDRGYELRDTGVFRKTFK